MILIISICITISLIYIKQIRNHTRAIKQCVLLLENIKIYIEYRNLSIEEIFSVLDKSNNYDLLFFLNEIKNEINADCFVDFNKIFLKNSFFNCFDEEDIENLKGFFSMLGRSDTNGQILNCNLYKKLFEKKYLQLEYNEKSQCKSAATLAMGVGLLFSIIVI